MGSWGYATFEDDMTLDWLGDFSRKPSQAAVTMVLNAAAKGDLDDTKSAAALAAAEVVAAMNGKPVAKLAASEPVGQWAAQQPAPSADLLKSARKAVERVFEESELREIWEDAGEESLEGWKTEIDDLISRLA
jgi:hypothetical protein